MFAIVAAILFGVALLFDLMRVSSDHVTPLTLTIGGLLAMALHMCGFSIGGRRG